MINSKQKGKKGEIELVHKLQEFGYDNVRRSQQYAGMYGDADLVNLDGIHIECKRVEKLNLYNAMSQSIHDSKPDEFPAVFHRRNYCDWLVTMRLDDWIQLYREWDSENKLHKRGIKQGDE